MTAAHCVYHKLNPDDFRVVKYKNEEASIILGSILRSNGGVRYGVNHIQVHGDYNHNTLRNDIAVMQTYDAVIIFNEFIQPIPLGTNSIGGEVTSIASGWGKLSVSLISLIFCKN